MFWNPARTIRSLLESVYVFLTVDEDASVNGSFLTESSRNRALAEANKTSCLRCGHKPCLERVWPPVETWYAARAPRPRYKSEQRIYSRVMYEDLTCTSVPCGDSLPSLPPAKYGVSPMASSRTTGKATQAMFDERIALLQVHAQKLVDSSGQKIGRLSTDAMEEFRCSISGVGYDHSNKVVLGFGVNVIRNAEDGRIASVTSDFTPFSREIFFKGGIRKSALESPMTHFFPFGINARHWKRALRILPFCVNSILRNGPEDADVTRPEERILFVVGELWKNLTLGMMKRGILAL